MKIRQLGVDRLCVHRTPRHIYAQIISGVDDRVLLGVSSLDRELRGKMKYGGNVDSAIQVGRILGERAMKIGLKKVALDRSGFKYHGRIKALADSAREQGMEF